MQSQSTHKLEDNATGGEVSSKNGLQFFWCRTHSCQSSIELVLCTRYRVYVRSSEILLHGKLVSRLPKHICATITYAIHECWTGQMFCNRKFLWAGFDAYVLKTFPTQREPGASILCYIGWNIRFNESTKWKPQRKLTLACWIQVTASIKTLRNTAHANRRHDHCRTGCWYLLKYLVELSDFRVALSFKIYPVKRQPLKKSINEGGCRTLAVRHRFDPRHVPYSKHMATSTVANELLEFTSVMQCIMTSIP